MSSELQRGPRRSPELVAPRPKPPIRADGYSADRLDWVFGYYFLSVARDADSPIRCGV